MRGLARGVRLRSNKGGHSNCQSKSAGYFACLLSFGARVEFSVLNYPFGSLDRVLLVDDTTSVLRFSAKI